MLSSKINSYSWRLALPLAALLASCAPDDSAVEVELGSPIIVSGNDVFGQNLDTYHWQLTTPPLSVVELDTDYAPRVQFTPDVEGTYELRVAETDARSRYSETLRFDVRDPFASVVQLYARTSCRVGSPLVIEWELDPGYTFVDVDWVVTRHSEGEVEFLVRTPQTIEFVPSRARSHFVTATVRTLEREEPFFAALSLRCQA